MSNKPTTIRRGQQPRPLTDEEKMAVIKRQLAQKRDSVAQGCLYNLCANAAHADKSPEALVDQALALADEYLERLIQTNGDETHRD